MWLGDGRVIAGLAAVAVAVFVAFSIWPVLDLSVTQAFYDGAKFPVEIFPGIESLRLALWNSTIAMAVFALAMAAATRFLGAPLLGLGVRVWGAILLIFVLGPGILVNVLLKEHWGRARPVNTANFGGSANFTPPYQITDQCASNCSFVSGEAAGSTAFAIAVLLILAANHARLPSFVFRLGQTIAVAVPLFTAWQRVAAGRHFLSDVVLAMVFVTLIAAVVVRAMRLR